MTPDPLLVDVPRLLSMLSIGRSKFYELISTGQFGPESLKIGGKKKLYRLSDVQDWVRFNCPSREKFLKLKAAEPEQIGDIVPAVLRAIEKRSKK